MCEYICTSKRDWRFGAVSRPTKIVSEPQEYPRHFDHARRLVRGEALGRVGHPHSQLVIHLLAGLEQAGVERAVVTLGHDAQNVAECVTAYGFTHLKIDFIYLTLGSAIGGLWRNLANSVIAARSAFVRKAPLLIVRGSISSLPEASPAVRRS